MKKEKAAHVWWHENKMPKKNAKSKKHGKGVKKCSVKTVLCAMQMWQNGMPCKKCKIWQGGRIVDR